MKELAILEAYLVEHGIRYSREDRGATAKSPIDKHQIIVYTDDGTRLWDAICHYGSYGYEQGLLEIMGVIVDEKKVGDSVEGWLTAQDVIERIEALGVRA